MPVGDRIEDRRVLSNPPTLNVDTMGAAHTPWASDLRPGPPPYATIVRERVNGRWEDAFLVTQSAALRSVGINTLGLYTLRPLRPRRQTRLGHAPASRLGQYGGTVIAELPDGVDAPASQVVVERFAREGRT